MSGYELPADAALRLPASKRISAPVSERLRTIVESDHHMEEAGGSGRSSPVPLKSILRKHSSASSLPDGPDYPLRPYGSRAANSTSSSSGTRRSRQPQYEWISEALNEGDENVNPAADAELQRLRQEQSSGTRSRGGWWRLLLIAAAAILVIGLAVGLGVGLTVGRHKNNSSGGASGGSGNETSSRPNFPLGQYSFVTALSEVETNCTSNSATWSCYPYIVNSPSVAGSNVSSATGFNWIITNTSATYATNATGSTPSGGIPANLSISTTSNYFNVIFNNQNLTYISQSGNRTSSRYYFEFEMSKATIPRTAITTDNTQAECFFNSTIFAGTIYLAAAATYPMGQVSSPSISQGVTQWPYAVEVTQTSPGGLNTPACYEYVNGVVGANITSAGLVAQPANQQCVCEYRNY